MGRISLPALPRSLGIGNFKTGQTGQFVRLAPRPLPSSMKSDELNLTGHLGHDRVSVRIPVGNDVTGFYQRLRRA